MDSGDTGTRLRLPSMHEGQVPLYEPFVAAGGRLLVELLASQPLQVRQAAMAAYIEDCNKGACAALAQGNRGKALKTLLRCHKFLGQNMFWTDADVRDRLMALTLNNMACERQVKGDLGDAQRFLEDAILIERRLEDLKPGAVENPAETFCNMGVVLSKQKKHAEAAAILLSAIDILHALRDKGDPRGGQSSLPTLAVAQHSLGAEYEHLCRWNDALRVHEECLTTVTQLMDEESTPSETLTALYDKARTAVTDVKRRVESETRLGQHRRKSKSPPRRQLGHTVTLSIPGQPAASAEAPHAFFDGKDDLYGDSFLAIDMLPGGRRLGALASVGGDIRRMMSPELATQVASHSIVIGKRPMSRARSTKPASRGSVSRPQSRMLRTLSPSSSLISRPQSHSAPRRIPRALTPSSRPSSSKSPYFAAVSIPGASPAAGRANTIRVPRLSHSRPSGSASATLDWDIAPIDAFPVHAPPSRPHTTALESLPKVRGAASPRAMTAAPAKRLRSSLRPSRADDSSPLQSPMSRSVRWADSTAEELPPSRPSASDYVNASSSYYSSSEKLKRQINAAFGKPTESATGGSALAARNEARSVEAFESAIESSVMHSIAHTQSLMHNPVRGDEDLLQSLKHKFSDITKKQLLTRVNAVLGIHA
jgi:tetratricopeptide (TPR) repeat protein